MTNIIKAEVLGSVNPQNVYVIDPGQIKHRNNVKAKVKISPEAEARAIVENAREEAEAQIAKAQAECDSISSAAYEEGYAAGYKELESERAAFSDHLAKIEAEVEDRNAKFWSQMEPELLKLSVKIAEKIIQEHIDENDAFVMETVKHGLRQIRERRDLKIRLNPDDYEFMRERKVEIISSCDGINTLELIDDRRIGKGGCLIESSNGNLDARISAQLGEVEKALLEESHDGKNADAAETE